MRKASRLLVRPRSSEDRCFHQVMDTHWGRATRARRLSNESAPAQDCEVSSLSRLFLSSAGARASSECSTGGCLSAPVRVRGWMGKVPDPLVPRGATRAWIDE